MSKSATEITNLLYRYAELIDVGDLLGASELFRAAKVKVAQAEFPLDHAALLKLWHDYIQIYPCGTPRTKHVITNPPRCSCSFQSRRITDGICTVSSHTHRTDVRSFGKPSRVSLVNPDHPTSTVRLRISRTSMR
jgi:hypothetical protein